MRPWYIANGHSKSSPNLATAHNNLGRILARRGQFDEALAHYQKALEIQPNFAAAHIGTR